LKLEEYRLVFIAVGLIGVLLLASPAVARALQLPSGEKFSELYVLGPGHMTEDYPFNVTEGRDCSVYVGVGNHMAASAYYVLYVKFRNQTELLPNSTSATPSPLQPLYEYRFFVADNETWEAPLVFSISEAAFKANQSAVNKIAINNVEFTVNKQAEWDMNSTGFYYQLFMELWIFDPISSSVEFHNRFVGLYLNLTRSIA
jgi:uncharacterized membrane protein